MFWKYSWCIIAIHRVGCVAGALSVALSGVNPSLRTVLYSTYPSRMSQFSSTCYVKLKTKGSIQSACFVIEGSFPNLSEETRRLTSSSLAIMLEYREKKTTQQWSVFLEDPHPGRRKTEYTHRVFFSEISRHGEHAQQKWERSRMNLDTYIPSVARYRRIGTFPT